MSKIDLGERGTYDTKNKLNELTSKEWLKFTKSWFIHNPPPRKKNEVLHPAKYPETMIQGFVEFFTKKNAIVLDPFLGTGSTLIACHECGRNGIGIELMEKYAKISKDRLNKLVNQKKLVDEETAVQRVILGDSHKIREILQKENVKIDFVITSPPYGPMLNKEGLVQDKRKDKNLDTKYSDDDNDFGNIMDYNGFIEKLVNVFKDMKTFLQENAYIVVILQNYTNGGEWKPLAWDFGKQMSEYFTLKGERIWCQDNKTLYPYGYRYSWVTNVHHHYCLIFKNDKD